MNATEAIAKAVSGTTDATEIVERLAALGFVCVPREPSAEMIEAAWAWELAEDSAGVWREMINAASIVPTVALTAGSLSFRMSG